MTEIRRGLVSATERRKVLELLGGCHDLAEPPALWTEAGDLGFALRRRGTTFKTVDLLIATYALVYGIPLLTADRDFEKMKRAGVGLILIDS